MKLPELFVVLVFRWVGGSSACMDVVSLAGTSSRVDRSELESPQCPKSVKSLEWVLDRHFEQWKRGSVDLKFSPDMGSAW